MNDVMGAIRVPHILKTVAQQFNDAGYECYLVGGAVRDMIIGLDSCDFDIATNARPEDVQQIFPRVIPTGIRHGTVTVIHRKHQLEVTTFRSEEGYSDRRRPDEITYVGTIDKDLHRRDFTMNAIALNCADGSIIDPTDGRADIRHRCIRAIGDPGERFSEDGLRLIRACRFAAQLEFDIEEETLEGMKTHLDSLAGVSQERIRDELFKILGSRRPSVGFNVLSDTGILETILPELAACRGVEQKGLHESDVYIHSLKACDAAHVDSSSESSPDRLEVRTAALFHDIGKPVVKKIGPDGVATFHRHEEHSESLTRNILKRLKCPRAFESSVCHLIRHHMFHYEPNWTDAAVRRFVHRVTPEYIGRLFSLRLADTAAIAGRPKALVTPKGSLAELSSRIDHLMTMSLALTIRDLAVDGNILAKEAGIPKSREMGTVLEYLLEAVLDDPDLNSREKLLEIASKYYEERLKRD